MITLATVLFIWILAHYKVGEVPVGGLWLVAIIADIICAALIF